MQHTNHYFYLWPRLKPIMRTLLASSQIPESHTQEGRRSRCANQYHQVYDVIRDQPIGRM